MTISLRMEGERIADSGFETYGCPYCIACGNWLASWVKGRRLEQVALIEAGDLMRLLGGLPLGKEHCAHLAVNALRDAIGQIQAQEKGEEE